MYWVLLPTYYDTLSLRTHEILSVLMGRSRGQKTGDYVDHRLKVKRTFRKRSNFRSCLIEYFREFCLVVFTAGAK